MDVDVDNRFVSKFIFFKNKCLQKGEYQVPYIVSDGHMWDPIISCTVDRRL